MISTAPDASPGRSGAPRDEIEHILVEIWSQALGGRPVGIHDNFYHLGGDSLLATVISCWMEDAIGIEVPLRMILEYPTVSRLAEQVRKALAGGVVHDVAGPNAPRADHASLEGSPLRVPRSGLGWLPSDAMGNVMAVVPLDRMPFDSAAVEQTVQTIVSRHETLRLSFTEDGRSLVDSRRPVVPRISLIDLRSLNLVWHQREREYHRIAAAEARRPFDPRDPPLLRATIVRIIDERCVIVLVSHRCVCDDISLGLIARELLSVYAAHSEGDRSPALPELPTPYLAFVRFQDGVTRADPVKLAYWRQQLHHLRPLPLPAVHSIRPCPSLGGTSGSFLLERRLSERLKELSRDSDATLFVTLLASFQVLLSSYADDPDVTVGSYFANRTRSETHGLVGPFAELVLLRSNLEGNPSFRQFLDRVRRVVLDAYDHTPFPLDQMEPGWFSRRDRQPWAPQAVLEFRTLTHPLGSLDRLVDTGIAVHPLTLFAHDSGDRVYFSFEYSTESFTHSAITEMAGRWRCLLEAVAADPERSIRQLLAAPSGRAQPIRVWRDDLQQASIVFLRRTSPAWDEASRRRALAPVDAGQVTVITAVHARSTRRIERFLRGLGRQVYAGRTEIVVCDDGSPIRAAMHRLCEQYGARYVRTERSAEQPSAMHKCRTLNAGLSVAQGDFILFLDQDMLLSRRHIQNCVNIVNHHGAHVVCASPRVEILELLAWEKLTRFSRFHLSLDRALELLDHVDACESVPVRESDVHWGDIIGNNIFISRQLAERVGPFDEGYIGYGEEDMDYAIRLHSQGAGFVRTTGLPAFHIGHPRQEATGLQADLYRQNMIRFFCKFPQAARERPQAYQMVRPFLPTG